MTAHHCTDVLGAVDGEQVQQPHGKSPVVGLEVYDHPFWTGTEPNTGISCPDTDGCRFSDAAVFTYENGVDYELGFVARPYAGSLTINSSNPRFEITGDPSEAYVYEGDEVFKVGHTTGLTYGNIESTCVTATSDAAPDRKYLCQWDTDYNVDSGDSGGPVLVDNPISADDKNVLIAGIHWGANLWNVAAFSYYRYMKWEPSPLLTRMGPFLARRMTEL